MNRIIAGSIIICIVSWYGIGIGNEDRAKFHMTQNISSPTGITKRHLKKVGPFETRGGSIVVMLDITELNGHPNLYHSFEIMDNAGNSYYRETLESTSESAISIDGIYKLQGNRGEGIIIYFDEPGTPPAGKSFQIFGIQKREIKPISPRINVYGHIEEPSKGTTKGTFKLGKGDILRIRVWKGLVGVVVPLVVDFKKWSIAPLIDEGILEIYLTVTPRQPQSAFRIPVKLYEDHNINAHIKAIAAEEIRSVKFLNAYAIMKMVKRNSDAKLDIDVSDLWLKVNIDGVEGWVTDQEDLFTLGLIPLS